MQIEMKNIVVDFGPVRAVDHVSIDILSGQIIGLLGENGAGKSTLMNVLAGTLAPTEGEIWVDGKCVRMESATHAARLGIRFIHQELSLCADLNVFENMFLAEEVSRGLLLSKREMARRAAEVFARMQVDINPWAPVSTLQPAQMQLVEIARALLFKSQLIIMDEPTTALSTHEIENLFVIMRQLQGEGVSFIYISHKMPELFEICGTYYVLRDGQRVADGQFADTDEAAITEMMIGRQLADDAFDDKVYAGTEEIALRAVNISGEGFSDISFDLHKGEVIAITGLHGSGRDMLADALFGEVPRTGGELIVRGNRIPNHASVIRHLRAGIAMVPRARKERGILNDLSILDNTSMGFLNTRHRKLLISPKAERERFTRQKSALSIKTDTPSNPITSLSGGNQQKVILGRWLETDADVLIFDNPTQGIDVGTKFEIYHLILRLARAGKAVLVFSSEFPEIYKVADSCMVLFLGKHNATLKPGAEGMEALTEKNMMYFATGANLEGRYDA